MFCEVIEPVGFTVKEIVLLKAVSGLAQASLDVKTQDIVFPLIVTPQFAQLDNTGFPVFVVKV